MLYGERKRFVSQRVYADDYADLVDSVVAMKKSYDSWWNIKQAIENERKGSSLLRGGKPRDDVAKAVRSALDEAETSRFWDVVKLAQLTHKYGTYGASSNLVKQVFKRSAGAFLAKFGIYLLD